MKNMLTVDIVTLTIVRSLLCKLSKAFSQFTQKELIERMQEGSLIGVKHEK